MNRVVITGMGAVSACGADVDSLWMAARDGISGVKPIHFPEMGKQQVKQAASIPAEILSAIIAREKPRLQDRVTAIALAATRQAVAQAGLAAGDFGSSCGVIVGSGFGGAETMDKNVSEFARNPSLRMDPLGIPKVMANAPASWISMEFGARGVTMCIATACSSATQAIGMAAHLIRHGMLTRCLAGGSEAMLTPSIFRGWELLRVMTAGLCRPFSEGRDGMVLGEGAGMLVLESLEAATARGAPIIAEIAGYGTTSDAADLLRPDPRGATDCMRAALADAGLHPADIGYVNAHGTGTVANEESETEALRNVFGDLREVLVSSTKPVHGHTLGAAGAIESIVAIKALCEQIAPPTINFKGIDPKLGIDPVGNVARPFSSNACLTNSFAFGGINATLVALRYPRGE